MQKEAWIAIDEDMVWERFHMVRPKMKGIHYLGILGLVYVIPATAWLIYRMVRRYQAADKRWMPSILQRKSDGITLTGLPLNDNIITVYNL